ncbi:hypothetical protein DHEL01_v212331 [Diaporthe helianthi]|uniref:U6 small nuclear RNA (adenine-(43)-N(6))-methyltransferase n=1 Tax=Diaporthe helianthi TaxID=158607 RepID=A0A2P5HGA5_DIAHE|nr:hypothetical protein DHEL01_v212331 [Diaporthe helianthi]
MATMATSRRDDEYYRSLYAEEPDFQDLALQDADFQAILSPSRQLDFADPAAVKQLTKTLLKVHFDTEIDLPDNRLCPPVGRCSPSVSLRLTCEKPTQVPNRHNYVLWLKGLLDSTSYNEPGGKLIGLDIGTGASCIYPLLACAQRPWSFIATDIDPDNLKHAGRNVQLNNLQSRVQVLPRTPTDPLVPLDELKLDSIDFVMTNPPFYESPEEMLRLAHTKARPPNSACTGAPVEMVCTGGEVAFVSRILDESLRLKERVQWYSCMFGMVSSLESMVQKLREHRLDNYAVTELVQGKKTRRWAVAWSFGPMRPSQDVCRGMKATPWRKVLPNVVEVEVLTFQETRQVGRLADKLSTLGGSLQLLFWEWDREKLSGIGRARENVWSRAWRRKRKREEEQKATTAAKDTAGEEQCALGFSVSVRFQETTGAVICRWLEGHNDSLFISFCGFIKTRLQAPNTSQTTGRLGDIKVI